MKKATFSLMLFFALIFTSTQVFALKIVFIHGANIGMVSQKEATEKFTQSFIDRIRKGNPYFVSYRDSSKSLKQQAIYTANQLYAALRNDTSIIVVAHSMGNLVTRYIMAAPTTDGLTSYQRYQMHVVGNKVKRLISIAGPHNGSKAADYVYAIVKNSLANAIVGMFGINTDAFKDLRPSLWYSWNRGKLAPSTFKRSDGVRPHVYAIGSRDATAGQPWYNRDIGNWGLWAVDQIVNYGSAHNSYYDRFPSKRVCVKRYWWGGCKTRKTVYGDGEVDNDGVVTVESAFLYGVPGKDSYWHYYVTYDSHFTNRKSMQIANWAKQFVY